MWNSCVCVSFEHQDSCLVYLNTLNIHELAEEKLRGSSYWQMTSCGQETIVCCPFLVSPFLFHLFQHFPWLVLFRPLGLARLSAFLTMSTGWLLVKKSSVMECSVYFGVATCCCLFLLREGRLEPSLLKLLHLRSYKSLNWQLTEFQSINAQLKMKAKALIRVLFLDYIRNEYCDRMEPTWVWLAAELFLLMEVTQNLSDVKWMSHLWGKWDVIWIIK